jgi:hypothetical protein
MTWRIELHGERPWTTNAERKWHHMQRAAKVKDTREAFGWMAKAIDGLVDAGVLPDDDPTFVRSLTFHPPEIGGLDGLRLEIEEVEYYVDD